MESFLVRCTGRYLIGCAALFLIVSCGDKDSASESQANCPGNQTYNKITGQCVSSASDGGGQDSPGNSDGDTEEDEIEIEPDPGPDCAEDADNDGDQLSNKCECELGTNQNKIDTDGDGLLDSEEDENRNCKVDRGETNPKKADMDQDGIPDGEEVEQGTDPLAPDTDGDGLDDGLESEVSCLDPTSEDSDGDGLPDGVEDQNGDGKLGTCCKIGSCSTDDYAPSCAEGESNPCKKDTNGDGTPDSDEARFQLCEESDISNLESPTIIENTRANYQLAVRDSVSTAKLKNNSIQGHVFEQTQLGYTGFIVKLEPNNADTISELGQYVIGVSQNAYNRSTQRSSGRKTTKHTGNKAIVGGTIDLPSNPSLNEARDTLLAEFTGADRSQLQHSLDSQLTGGTGSGRPTLFAYEIVQRQTGAVLVGTLVTYADYTDNSIKNGIHVDDLTGGSSLTTANQGLKGECVSYEIKEKPKVDIILSMDASQSMRDEQESLAEFSSKFTQLLNEANVDWRIGVTSVACNHIKQDPNLSSGFRQLWPEDDGSGGGLFGGPGPACTRGNQIPPAQQGQRNGHLVGGNFTSNAFKVSRRIEKVNDTNSEYTFTMAAAATDRALPRRDGDPSKIRLDANLVLIGVTDEEDAFFSRSLDFLPKQGTGGLFASGGLSPTEKDRLEKAVKPWSDYLLRSKVGATVFGLYWPPGEDCSSAATVGHAISRLVKETGGNGGSLCQADITNTLAGIAEATAGIASGLRLRGTPAPQSIQVKHVDKSDQSTDQLSRSRSDGFKYDAIVNRISFSGPKPPETGDRVVIPYLRWEGSILRCQTNSDCDQAQKKRCIKGVCR